MRYNQEDVIKYRLEALKMAYEFSYKIFGKKYNDEGVYTISEETGDFNIKPNYTRLQIREDLQDVFSLAEMNFEYILNGTFPEDDEENEDETV